jgi:hypothetical protein
MYYRIIKAPPGYGPTENYMVAAYETAELPSKGTAIRKADGSRFTATLEEARKMLPPDAKPVSFEPYYQSLELWEVKEQGG